MLLHFMVLYRTRVQAPVFASLGAAFSAMALQLTVGRAVAEGLIKDGVPFLRTAKGCCGARRRSASRRFWEAVLGVLLAARSLGLYVTNEPAGARDLHLQRGACWCRACLSLPRWLVTAVRALAAQRVRHLAEAGGDLPLTGRACRAAASRPPGPPASGDVGILP